MPKPADTKSPSPSGLPDQPANRTLYTCDNLTILRSFPPNAFHLIYLDPPFNSNRDYDSQIRASSQNASFTDKWALDDVEQCWPTEIERQHPALGETLSTLGKHIEESMFAYLLFMSVRLLEIKRVLHSSGSVYLHCDPTSSHYLKVVLDIIFGAKAFRNEIVWKYGLGGSSKKVFSKKHDIILLYAPSARFTFNKPTEPSTSAAMKGKPKGMTDVWDVPTLNNMSKERTGYPTQKPLDLLRRIISASTNEGDLVLDPFCGSGTTCVAAEELGRRWIGIDNSPEAREVLAFRFKDVPTALFGAGVNKELQYA